MTKRNLAIALAAGAMLTQMAGTASITYAEEAADKSVLVVGTSLDFQGLSVLTSVGGAGGKQWKEAVYPRLATREVTAGDAIPVMMESIEHQDGLVYRIKIYDDIYDSDGNHITADDVAFCFNYAKENGVSQTYNYIGMTVVDDYTVDLEMATDAIGVLDDTIAYVEIVDQEAFEADGTNFATRSCGCGPYKITDFVDGSYYTLEKVENWWGYNHEMPEDLTPNVDKIIFQYIAEASQLAIALESGTVDMTIGLTGTETDRFLTEDGKALEGFSEAHYLSSLYQIMLLNMDYESVFYDNQDLREAILYAIDKEALVIAALNQKGEKCYTLGSENFGDFQDQWKEENYFDYDIEKAQELLNNSGFDTSQTLRIMLDTNEIRIKEAQLISAYLGQIGIKTEILSYDTALYDDYKLDASQWDIMLDNFYSPDYLVSGWSHVFYYENYKNGSANHLHDDALIEMIVEANTPEGHTDENVNALHEYIRDTASAVGLIDSYNYIIGREGIDIYLNGYQSTPYSWVCGLSEDFASVGK